MSSNSNQNDGTNDGKRRSSRRFSDGSNNVPIASVSDPTPKRLRFSSRLTQCDCCADFHGLPSHLRCSGCVRWDESKKLKPRDQCKTREMQCYKVWKITEEKDVPNNKMTHWLGLKDFVTNNLRLNPSVFEDETPAKTFDNNDNEAQTITPTLTPATKKPPPKLNCWNQKFNSQGREITLRVPTSHECVNRAHLKRWQRDSKTLKRIRKKVQATSNSSNLYAQSLWAIACASVPALGLSAGQCMFPITFFAMMADTGLFSFKEFNLKKHAQAFPSDAHLRTMMHSQAGRDMLSLGKEFQDNAVPIYLSCDKGNKGGVGHFVKHLSWFDFDNMVVKKQLLDLDGSDGASEACAFAIKHSLLKLGHDQQLSGQTTDSGGGGVLEGLADELAKLNLCTENYIVAACSIHGLQMQLSNAVEQVIGKGGLEQRNALQMLHSVYDLQASVDSEEWRHILHRATEFCSSFDPEDDTLDETSEFTVQFKQVMKLSDFPETKLVDANAKMEGTVLEKVQAPVLTRWWTVGKGAAFMLQCYLPILRACQIIINRHKSDSKPNKIASGLFSLMTNPSNLADLALIKCFNGSFIRRHLDWMQSNVDLSGAPGFQAHQMAIRYCFMHQDLGSMFDQRFQGFEDYRLIVSKLDDNDKELQDKKESLFIKISQDALEKHFPRWIKKHLLPAALLSESGPATVIAGVMLKNWDYINCYEQSNKFFYSEVHGRRLEIKPFAIFVHKHCREMETEDYSPEVIEAAERVLDGWDFRCTDLSTIEDEDELELRKHVFATYLPIASHTQFVEFGVKEAKLVAQTNRSEELRSSYAIVRSAHVTDAGNSRSGSTNVDMIVNRINTALISAMNHSEMMLEDEHYSNRHETVLRLLKHGHFKKVRIECKKTMIDESQSVDKKMNASQKTKEQELTAAVTGHVLFGKLVQRLHMDDLKTELVCRGVDEEQVPATVTARKKMLQEMETTRLREQLYMSENDANTMGKKQFEALSEAEFAMG